LPEAWCRKTIFTSIPWTAGTANHGPSFREFHLPARTVTLALTAFTKKPQALTLKILETPTDITQNIYHTEHLKTYA
ncbi:hypothetical protein, partial [Salmonella sp. gx-f5]|uniref:hypothetical protein n=1 Tax=Salmonella sp. gx-f5 TaxID=2582605 RepID=UPI001F36B175